MDLLVLLDTGFPGFWVSRLTLSPIAIGIGVDKGRVSLDWIFTGSTLRCLYLATVDRATAHVFVKHRHYALTVATAIHVIHGKRVRWSIGHFLVEEEIPYKAKSNCRVKKVHSTSPYKNNCPHYPLVA